MTANDTIAALIDDVRQGDEQAVQAVWEEFFPQLCRIAASHLVGQRRGDADEEDIALSAFASFCKAAAAKRLPDLVDRRGLWCVLSEMTRRKAVDLIRHRQRAKRDARRTLGESALMDAHNQGGIDRLSGEQLTPALSMFLQEEARTRLSQLNDSRLERLALLRLHGHTNREIAGELECSVATVERQLNLIRKIWQQGD